MVNIGKLNGIYLVQHTFILWWGNKFPNSEVVIYTSCFCWGTISRELYLFQIYFTFPGC